MYMKQGSEAQRTVKTHMQEMKPADYDVFFSLAELLDVIKMINVWSINYGGKKNLDGDITCSCGMQSGVPRWRSLTWKLN